jgi:anti-anti-sigma factor
MRLIEVEQQGDILVLTPQQDLRELDYLDIEEVQREVLLQLADDPALRNVVVDLGKTDYFGSTALGLLIRLGRQVRARNGRLALCNVSAHEQDILAVTGLGRAWPAYLSREEALAAVEP